MSKIKIFSLGVLNEDGKNMYIVDVDNDIFVFDVGLKYVNNKILGIDYKISDFHIKRNEKKNKGYFYNTCA